MKVPVEAWVRAARRENVERLNSPLSEQVDDEAGDRDLRTDECRSLNPQGAIELAAGEKLAAVGFGRGAKLRRYGFRLVAFDTSGLEVAGGSKRVEGGPVHG